MSSLRDVSVILLAIEAMILMLVPAARLRASWNFLVGLVQEKN